MTSKQIIVLGTAAVVLGGLAWYTNDSKKMRAPDVIGKRVLPKFDLSDVAKIECGSGEDKLSLASGEDGWTITSLYGYPADVVKIRENLLKLQDLKAGDLARGKKIENGRLVDLQDEKGKSLAALTLGAKHNRPSSGDFGGGGYADGRYVQAAGKTDVLLVKETLDAFDGDPKQWTDTQIASVPTADISDIMISAGTKLIKLAKKSGSWTMDGIATNEEFNTSNVYGTESALSYLNFTGVADPALGDEVLGIETGAVYTAGTKNGQIYTARIGNPVKDGTDRYVKLSATFTAPGTNTADNAKWEQAVKDFNAKNAKWVYTISSYSADNMTKSRSDFVKAKEEKKSEGAAATSVSAPVEIKTTE